MAIRAGGCHAFYTRSAIFFMQSLKRFYQLIAPWLHPREWFSWLLLLTLTALTLGVVWISVQYNN
jgi:putative ATP-binding cassette transporter